jgi:hypothetical protein
MKYEWGRWSSVSGGQAIPGAPVSAIRDGNRFKLVVADSGGAIFATVGTPDNGWAPWSSVAEGKSIPGARVTADWDGKRFVLFVADIGGGIFTTAGASTADWQPWSSVSEGNTVPGARITSVWYGERSRGVSPFIVRFGGRFALFVADRRGGIFTTEGTPDEGWGPWSSVSGGQTTPGAPVTAVRFGERIALFVADPGGGVVTTVGTPDEGWGPWSSVSDGRTTPGAPVAAAWDGRRFAVFVANPSGGVITTVGTPAAGWEEPWSSVSEGQTIPGAPVTAVWDGERFALFVADRGGGIFTTVGIPNDAWGPWFSVSEGKTMAGAPITAFWDSKGEHLALFVADPAGGIFTVSSRPPLAPANLRVTSVAPHTINLSWTDDADDVDGFRIRFSGARENHDDAPERTITFSADARTATLTGLLAGYRYTVDIAAFNASGESARSNSVKATVPLVPETVTISLARQVTDGPVSYVGQYPPALGLSPPGHLRQIALPQSTSVLGLAFLKPNHTNLQCDDPTASVLVFQGDHTSPEQLAAIFDRPNPQYSSFLPLGFLACLRSSPTAPLLDLVEIELTIISDV